MLVYVEFDDKSCGYYDYESVYIDNRGIETSKVYFDGGYSFPLRSLRCLALCKDGGQISKTLYERRD